MMLIPHICWAIIICEYKSLRGRFVYNTYHDNSRRLCCTANTWNCEQLNEPSEEVAFGGNPRFFDEDLLLLELCMDVVELAGSLKWGVSKAKQRLVCLGISSFGHEPSKAICQISSMNSRYSYLGDSGQNRTPATRGTAGMKAEPSCNLL